MTPSLHIAFFNRAFHPEESATGQLLTDLARGLAKDHGCRVSIVAGMPPPKQGGGSFPKRGGVIFRDDFEGMAVYRARGTSFPKKFFPGRAANYLTYFASACLAGLRVQKPDVVIALTDPPIIGLAGLLCARRNRCPFVISFRDLFPEVGRLLKDFRSPFVDGVLDRINRFLIRRADRLVALGEAMKRRLVEEKGAAPDRVVIIPDWADTSVLTPGPKRNPFSAAHGLDDRFVVMHAGNLGLSQNLEVLVDSARFLYDLKDLELVFIGDGVLKNALQDQVARLGLRRIRFFPFQPKERLSEAFASADCFLISLKPGLSGYITPSKLYGILAAGRPYVAAVDPDCDVARITREFQCGLLAKTGDPEDIAEKIRSLHADRKLAQEMGVRARGAAGQFDRSVGIRAYNDLCRALVLKTASHETS